MNRGDEMAANIETGEGQSAGAAAGSDDSVNEQLRVTFKRRAIYNRLLAIEKQTKKRSSRGFTRYLLAICIGVAATLA